MGRIRKVEIRNFRTIRHLDWFPSAGVNCLIGPGDSGKSTILDAIDLCLGARRNLQINDTDFFNLDVEQPISITLTIGALTDSLKNLDAYGQYLRGYDDLLGDIEDEPSSELETVLCLQMTVASDLEPSWSLISDRATAAGVSRNLSWNDRLQLAPNRLGAAADYNLSWRRGSLLNKISDERASAAATLIKAARDARAAFGEEAKGQLAVTLKAVSDWAQYLGVDVGPEVRALIDAQSVSFNAGTISLHNDDGVPLRSLGLGSQRLLIAGLQRSVAVQASIVLVDELEHGLEPHRIVRFLDALGAKDAEPLQVFVTTHSPVAVSELSVSQLFIVRKVGDRHEVRIIPSNGDIQGTIRKYPGALLARSILVCEGASEVGLVRGVDHFSMKNGGKALAARGVALLDGGGDTMYDRALAVQSLGYRVAVLRDSDVNPPIASETQFLAAGGTVFAWRAGRALEDELFLSLTNSAITELLDHACELKDELLVNEHIKSASLNTKDLNAVRAEIAFGGNLSVETRTVLGKASRNKNSKRSWYKSVSAMQHVGEQVVAPRRAESDPAFVAVIDGVFNWIGNA